MYSSFLVSALINSVLPDHSNASINKRQHLRDQLSFKTKYSLSKVIVDSAGHTGYGHIGAFVDYKVELDSKCSESYEHDENLIPFLEGQCMRVMTAFIIHIDNMCYTSIMDEQYKLPPTPDGINATFCIKNPLADQWNFGHIFREFERKSLSFWFDLTIDERYFIKHRLQTTGEITFGEPNARRFVPGTAQSFNLQPFTKNPQGWISNDLVTITIDSKPGGARRFVQFDIGTDFTFLPPEMFNAVVSPYLMSIWKVATTLDLPLGLQDTINEYAYDPRLSFPCSLAQKHIFGFILNDLVVPKEFLYDQEDEYTCLFRVRAHADVNERNVVVGLRLIKQFHMTVDFGDEPKIDFSKRKGAKIWADNNRCAIC